MNARRCLLVLCITGFAMTSLLIPASATQAVSSASPTPSSGCSPAAPAYAGGTGAPLAAAGTDFGFAAFHRLFVGAPRANTFISPLSIALALEMVYGGARGGTQTAMARLLGIQTIIVLPRRGVSLRQFAPQLTRVN